MMDMLFSSSAWLGALIIFVMRVLNITLDTLRVLFVMRGHKAITWIVGFLQTIIFVLVFTSVLSNLDNPIYLVAYAAGFATGNVVGMWLEGRLAIGFVHIQIVSPRKGAIMAQKLRENGFAVTEIPARGKDGMVSVLSVDVRRREVAIVEKITNECDEAAFVTSEDIHPVRRGFWRA